MDLPLRRPPRLRPGQTIGLISPSGPTSAASATTPELLEAARANLSQAGFRTVVAPHALDVRGYLAGADADRAADLHAVFEDPAIHAVLCIRGGYGAMRLLDVLDYDLIRRHPKIFVGYSDVTALHLAFSRLTGLVTFHGPMATALARRDGHDLDHLLRAVTRPDPLGRLINPPGGPEIETLVPGVAEGPLIGGNAALVTSLLGTPYLPRLEGAVLFFEDILDSTYRLDRKLVALRLAGVLRKVNGIVIGECRLRAEPKAPSLSIREILEDLIVPLGKPAIYGLACGHGTDHLTLPIGVRARLDAARGALSIEDPSVS
ncbi:MAG TPA: LD-carboxypeptidase [bacterium]|nr:LD-carboxypeptidase [bacterium]